MSIIAQLAKFRIAITGSSGFIGHHLLTILRSLKVSVFPIEGDVRCFDTWKEKFDLLYHLAAVMPGKFADSPQDAFSVNVNGTLLALEACRKNKAHMVFTSTASVYRPSLRSALSEDHSLSPKTAYAQSKLIGEMLCRSYANHYGVKCTIFRLFNVYGLGQNSEFIIPYLIKCGLGGSTAYVHHPDSARDFIYLKDVLDILLRAILADSSVSIFNVGSGRAYKVREVIDVIGRLLKRPLLYQQIESQPDPYHSLYANIKRAAKDLGWSPTIGLKEGIQEIINSFRNEKDYGSKMLK